MPAVIANPAAGGAVPLKRGKKKLFVVLVTGSLLVAMAGGSGVFYLRHKAAKAAAEAFAADGEHEGKEASTTAADAGDTHNPPTYLPLDPFVINLADRDTDRYAQIGITLEVQSPAFAEQMKTYMPAVRNAILLVITRKTSRDLLDPSGKELLADEIMREAVRPMGIDIAAPMAISSAPETGASGVEKAAVPAEPAPKKSRRAVVKNPIQHVNFSSFIIQ